MANYNSKREHYRNVARKHEAMIEQKYQSKIRVSIKGTKVYSVDAFADKEVDDFTQKAKQIVWPLLPIKPWLRPAKIIRNKK